jgi:hypothetical protein
MIAAAIGIQRGEIGKNPAMIGIAPSVYNDIFLSFLSPNSSP